MAATACTRGRPREFCTEAALAAALRVFWSRGYEGASMAELTEAMGITKPSLYAAFGNKEQLFLKALDLYEREKLSYMQAALAAPTSREVLRRLLGGAIDNQTAADGPRGCLGVISTVQCGTEAESVRADVLARTQAARDAFNARMQRACDEGDLPPNTDVEGLTAMMIAIMQGMAVQAGAGATREQLERLADAALAAWPGRDQPAMASIAA